MATDHNFKVKNGLVVEGGEIFVQGTTTPQIYFNGSADSGIDMAIKATPESLDFYEPEDNNKLHMRIVDDAGVNAVFGFRTGAGDGTIRLDASGNLQNIGTISSGTISSGSITAGDSSTAAFLRAHYNDGSYMTLEGYGLVMNRGSSYIRPSTNGDKALYIGGADDSLDWNAIYFRSDNGLSLNGSNFIDASRNLQNIGTISSGAITATGTTTLSGLTVDGAAMIKHANSTAYSDSPSWNAQSFDTIQIYNDNSTSSTSADQVASIYMRADGAGNAAARIVLRNDNSGNGRLYFQMRSGSHTGVTQPKMLITDDGYVTISDNATTYNERLFVDGNLRVEGVYKSGTQTIIDASRNLTNIGTISSGAITSSGKITVDQGSHNPASGAPMDAAGLVLQNNDGNMDLLSYDDNSTVANNIGFGRFSSTNGALIHKFGITHWANVGSQGSNTGNKLAINYGTDKNPWNNSELFSINTGGKTSIAASTSTSSSGSLKLHVGTINNTGSSAIAQFGGFIRASDYYILHASTGSTDSLYIDYVGDDMDITVGEGSYTGVLRANGYKVGTTTVIDSSRNLTNIGSLALSSSITVNNNQKIYFKNASGTSNSFLYRAGGNATRFEYADNVFIFDAASNTDFEIRNSADVTVFKVDVGATAGDTSVYSAGNLNAGSIQTASTTRITSSGNLTNIGSISSGAITATNGNVTISTGYNLQWGSGYSGGHPSISATSNAMFFYPTGNVSGANFRLYASMAEIRDGNALRFQRAGNSAYGELTYDSGENITLYSSWGGKYLRFTREGHLQLSGTTVIDASRNLTNISAITSSGTVTADKVLAKNTGLGADDYFAINEHDTTESILHKFDKEGNTNFTKVTDGTAPARGVFQVSGYHAITWGPYIPIDDDTEIVFECWAKYISGGDTTGNFYAGGQFYDQNQTSLGNNERYWGANGDPLDADSGHSDWKHIKGVLKGSAIRAASSTSTAKFVRLLALFNYNAGDNTTRYCGFRFYDSRKTITSLYHKRANHTSGYNDTGFGASYAGNDSNDVIQVIDTAGNFTVPGTLTVDGATTASGTVTLSGTLYSTNSGSNAIHTRFIAGAASGSTSDGPLYLQYGKSQDIRMFEASGANRKLYIYGNDSGTDRWGGLSIATDGSFVVQASDTYLVLQAGSYVQSSSPHNFTSSILFNGTTVIDTNRNITGNVGTFRSDSEAVRVSSLTNGVGATILFSDNGAPPALTSGQRGYLRYYHGDGASYGSGNAFVLTSTESTMTVLADGKLMYKDGLYVKPSSGTGAGTELIDSSRNIKNINTIASGPITITNAAVTNALPATNSSLILNAQEAGVHIIAENGGDWASHLILTNQGNRHYWIHNAPSTAGANASKFELRTSTTTTAAQIGGQGDGSTAVLVVDSSGNLTAAGNYVYLVDSNNYVYVDQSTGTNMSFGLNGNTVAQIKRIGSNTASFRPRQYSSGDTAAGYPAYAEIDDENTGLYFPAADEVGISTGGTKRLTVASNGKVNIFGNVDIGGATTGCTVEIAATDTSGAPASTTTLLMKGYEGRGIGTMFEDVSYSGEEWFAGMQYGGNFNGYTIGYSSSGGQAEYSANSIARFETDGSWYHKGTQLINGDREFVNLKRLNFISSNSNTEGINFGNSHRIYWNSQRVFEGNGSNLQVGEGLSGAINIQADNGIQMNGVQVIDANRNLFADGLYVKKVTGATSGNGVANGVNISSHFTSQNHSYIVELVTYGTGTDTGACYIVYYTQDTNTWSGRAVSLSGSSSNHPLLDVTSAGVITMYTNHASAYNIHAVIHTHVGPENDSTPHVLGPYYQWQRDISNNLYYNDGNVFIGKTNNGLGNAGIVMRPGGEILLTRAGDVANFNRTGSNGVVTYWRKDNNAVGEIGIEGGDSLYIQSTGASGSGLRFHPSTPAILPVRNGATIDSTVALGSSTRRFSDLQTVQINSGTVTITKGTGDQQSNADGPTVPTTSAAPLMVFNGNYTNGSYQHRLIKIDRIGNLPLYMQTSSGTANSYTNIMRFGVHSNTADPYRDRQLLVFGKMGSTGSCTANNYMINGNEVIDSSQNITTNGNIIMSGTDNFLVIENSAETNMGIVFTDLQATPSGTGYPQTSSQAFKIQYHCGNETLIMGHDDDSYSGFDFGKGGRMRVGNGTAASPSHSFINDANTGIFSNGADTIGFATNGINRVNLGNTKLSLQDGVGLDLETSSGNVRGLIVASETAPNLRIATSNGESIGFYDNGTSGTCNLEIDGGGNVVVRGNITAYGNPSDINLKENIQTIPNAVEKVQKLDGITFNYKKDGGRSTGLIAQQLQEVLPEVVYTAKDLEGEEHLAVRYGNVVGLLVEAIKEQQTQLTAQQEQINQLTILVNKLMEK